MSNSKTLTDTIAAVATPAGVGGVAMLRISGKSAVPLASAYLRYVRNQPIVLSPRKAHFALFEVDGVVIDEVVATFFQAPHSYTGEDVVELSCHGSLYVQQAILQALLDGGARLADPGEFTQRAFLNGRLDLSQAEAVADLIDATNAAAGRLAVSQLRGGYASRLRELRSQFVDLVALLELELDFSEEDVEFADRSQLNQLLDHIHQTCSQLADSFQQGNAVKNGVPVAILGAPNAGKSTLLNALLGEDRAIVSDIPGTTRDTIEDTITLKGITYRFIDTAGIRNTPDVIEAEGVRRSLDTLSKARVVLYMVDAALSPDQLVDQLLQLQCHSEWHDKQLLLIVNKIDKLADGGVPCVTPDTLDKLNNKLHSPIDPIHLFFISAKSRTGLDSMLQALQQLYCADIDFSQPMLTNLRHYEAMLHIVEACQQARNGLAQNLPADLVVVDIREALYYLGTITGEISSNDILGTIFSRFCIGK